MKPIFLALSYAAISESVICHFASQEYSATVDAILTIFAVLGSIVLGIFAPGEFMAFCGASGLATPAISYSMLGYGFLEMGGLVHALAFGIVGSAAFKFSHGFSVLPPPEYSEPDTAAKNH
jgi:hypothetical protein